MSSQTAMSLLGLIEFAVWAMLGILFWSKGLHRRFPAMGGYLALHVASAPLLAALFYAQTQHWFNNYSFDLYFYLYWAVYAASAVLLYFVCIEVFRSALSAFTGIQRLGAVAFRWAALASAIVSLSTLSFDQPRSCILPAIAFRLIRPVSILELCLLGFLCLSMNALRLSTGNMAFGIALGFGLLSTNDFVESLVVSTYTTLTAPWQFVYESVILVVLGIWVTYCALPEPVSESALLPANSLIYRWNEIALALGHAGTKVAVERPAAGFFLNDVEQVVDRVFAKNLERRESES